MNFKTGQAIIKMLGVILLVCLSLYSCNSPEPPLQSYYFPKIHQVYVYSANDSIGREYWEIKPEGKTTLVTRVYSGSFVLKQESREEFYSNGVNLENLELIASGEKIPVDIQSGFIFPFNEIDYSEVVFYRVNWEVPTENGNNTSYDLIRNRRFMNLDQQKFLGESRDCVKIKLEERIISDLDGSIELSSYGSEYYAKDIGLIHRNRQFTSELLITTKLLEILTVEEFDQLRKGG